MGERDEKAIPEGTHCEWCGAEFEQGQEQKAARGARTPAPVKVGDEPPTHCEWCGAEYPVPGQD